MSRSLNKVTLIGNLGSEPEVRSTANGTRVATLSVATSRSWNNQAGERQEKTEWHRVVLWKQSAEFAGEYLRKGAKVYIEGRLETRSWEDKDGVKRYKTEVRETRINSLDSRTGSKSDVKNDEPDEADDLPF